MQTKRTIPRVFATFVLIGAFVTGCTIPIYHQVDQANSKVSEIKSVFDEADKSLDDARDLSNKVYSDSLSSSVMTSNGEAVKDEEEKLAGAKQSLEDVEGKINELKQLRLPAEYANTIIPGLEEARNKRIEAVSIGEELLFRSGNLASAVVNYYSAINRLEQIGTLMGQIPEISFENPSTIEQAQAILEEVSTETTTTQTELNNAAAEVNVEVFTRLRDSATDLRNMADAADQLVDIFEVMLQTAITGDDVGFAQAYEQLPLQLEILIATLDKFDQSFPYEFIDQNNDLTTKGQNLVQTWKDENLKPVFDEFDDKMEEIDDADQKVVQGLSRV